MDDEEEVESEGTTPMETAEEPDAQDGGDDSGEVSIALGDPAQEEEKPEQDNLKWAKLRRERAELLRENLELKRLREAEMAKQQSFSVPEVGQKPAISDPGIDYDAAKFEEELLKWNQRKLQVEQFENEQRMAMQKQKEEWEAEVKTYEAAKRKLRVPDFAEAEVTIAQMFNPEQQGIIIHAADTPAELIYAIGNNPSEAKRLADIKDPMRFAFAVAKLEATKLKVTKKDSAPAPERRIGGSAPISGASDARLEQLRREAEKTGDMSKVIAYRRAQKKALDKR